MQGIGEVIAQLFAANGTTVVLADIDTDGAERVLNLVEKQGGRGRGVRTYVSKPADSELLVSELVQITAAPKALPQ